MSTIGERIQLRMKKKGIKQIDLINVLNISKGTISNWVNDKTEPSGANLVELAGALGCNPGWLANESDTEEWPSIHDLPEDEFNELYGSCLVQEQRVPYVSKVYNDVVFIPFFDDQNFGSTHPEAVVMTVEWAQKLNLDASKLKAISILDNTMEPYLEKGDIALVDLRIQSPNLLQDRCCYVFRYGGEAKIRRVTKKYDGTVILSVDNLAKDYQSELIPSNLVDSLTIYGKVVWRSGPI